MTKTIVNDFLSFVPVHNGITNEILEYHVLYAGMAIGYFDLNGILKTELVNASNDEYFKPIIRETSELIKTCKIENVNKNGFYKAIQ